MILMTDDKGWEISETFSKKMEFWDFHHSVN